MKDSSPFKKVAHKGGMSSSRSEIQSETFTLKPFKPEAKRDELTNLTEPTGE